MNSLHVYVSPSQPATRFVDDVGGHRRWFRCAARRLWWTDCCRTRRWAQYVRVQVYYDEVYRSCAPGHGCHA